MNEPVNEPMNEKTPRKPDVPVEDLRHVCCGLVPAILDVLRACPGDEIEVLVRAGIETEIINGFGSGGDWNFQLLSAFGHGRARFTRRTGPALPPLRLDTLDY